MSTTVDAKLGFPTGSIPGEEGITIIRTRGDLLVRLTTSNVIGAGFDFGFGMGIVTNQAFAAGIASIPGPLTDSVWEGWFVHKLFTIAGDLSTSISSSMVRYEIDSKAMRKFSPGNSLIAVIETDNEVGTVTLQANLLTRLLLKLS